MNWFITGGLGFVGLNLVNKIFEKFDNQKLRIVIYDSLKVSKKKDLNYLYKFNSKILQKKKKLNLFELI